MRICRGLPVLLSLLMAAAFAIPAAAQQQEPPAAGAPAKRPARPARPALREKPAPAVEAKPTLLAQFADWGAYTASPGGKKVCFAHRQADHGGDQTAEPPAQSGLHVCHHPARREGDQRGFDRNRLSVQAGHRGQHRGRNHQIRACTPKVTAPGSRTRPKKRHGRHHAPRRDCRGEGRVLARARRRPIPIRSRDCRRRSTASPRNASRIASSDRAARAAAACHAPVQGRGTYLAGRPSRLDRHELYRRTCRHRGRAALSAAFIEKARWSDMSPPAKPSLVGLLARRARRSARRASACPSAQQQDARAAALALALRPRRAGFRRR